MSATQIGNPVLCYIILLQEHDFDLLCLGYAARSMSKVWDPNG